MDDGFEVVVGMMGGEDVFCFVGFCEFLEELVADFAAGFLDAGFVFSA